MVSVVVFDFSLPSKATSWASKMMKVNPGHGPEVVGEHLIAGMGKNIIVKKICFQRLYLLAQTYSDT